MNCERLLVLLVLLVVLVVLRFPHCRNTEPPDLLAANSIVRSLKGTSLKGPLPKTTDRTPCQCFYSITNQPINATQL